MLVPSLFVPPLHNLLPPTRQAGMWRARVTQVGSAKAVETPKHIRREGPVPTRLPPSRYHHHNQSINQSSSWRSSDTMMVGWLMHNTQTTAAGGRQIAACLRFEREC
jgi:hypothetical protein